MFDEQFLDVASTQFIDFLHSADVEVGFTG
jgi:hypothetical protein